MPQNPFQRYLTMFGYGIITFIKRSKMKLSTENFYNLSIRYLKVKKGFNVKKIRGHRTHLRNKLDLM